MSLHVSFPGRLIPICLFALPLACSAAPLTLAVRPDADAMAPPSLSADVLPHSSIAPPQDIHWADKVWNHRGEPVATQPLLESAATADTTTRVVASVADVPATPTVRSETVGVRYITGLSLEPLASGPVSPLVGAAAPSRTLALVPYPTIPGTAPPTQIAPQDASQRLLLARLDADLARASTQLDTEAGGLSRGQQQLSQFTNVLQDAMLASGDDARGLHPFVKVAQHYLGTPYVWGGVSARGFDCSGFIIRVMLDLGYRALPHSAAEQFHYGVPVARDRLKPGDLIFFANTYKPGVSHVGIYLGRRHFIHAANSNVGTIVSSIDEPKWVEKYAGARRLLPLKQSG